jgi:type I restriction enzyme S subunit
MSEWRTVALHDVATIKREIVEPSGIEPGTLYIGLENIESGGKIIDVRSVHAGELASSKFAFTQRHLLYGKLRPYLAKIARPQFEGICSTDILPVLPGPELDRDYLAYYLLKPDVVARANSRATGANLPRISPQAIGEIKIPLPKLPEQRRIAEVLDRAEALRAKRRAALAQLDTLTQAIFLDLFGDPTTNPKGWPISGIEQVCELIVDCVNRTDPVTDERTPFKMIRTSNVKNGRVNLADVKYVSKEIYDRWNRRATPRPGDVLLTREAPVGEAGMLDTDDAVFLGQRLMLYRANSKYVTPTFLLFSFLGRFLQNQFNKHGSGSTVKHLPLPVCRSFKMLVPPISLQREFARRISAIEKLKSDHRVSLSELDALFASLQHRAFRGEL